MHWSDEPDGPGFWVVTKYADVVAVGRDGATYSSDQKRGGVVVLEEFQMNDFEQGGNLMLTMDAPEHTRYRKLVNRGFTPRQIGALEDRIREQTNKILDEVIEQGTSDFVVDVAAELPLQVIAEMLGVPQEDRHKLFEWSNRMIGSEDPEYIVSEEEVQNAQIEMFMYANALAAERREMPRDDIGEIKTLVDSSSLSSSIAAESSPPTVIKGRSQTAQRGSSRSSSVAWTPSGRPTRPCPTG